MNFLIHLKQMKHEGEKRIAQIAVQGDHGGDRSHRASSEILDLDGVVS